MSYGIAPSLTKRRLTGVPPLAVAAGSQVAAALLLAVPAALAWPAHGALGARVADGRRCSPFFGTGLAYLLYFRLIANAGPANAVAVTYLIPIFAVAWGGMFLGERLTLPLVAGCVVIFLGTALATGISPRTLRRAGPRPPTPERRRRRPVRARRGRPPPTRRRRRDWSARWRESSRARHRRAARRARSAARAHDRGIRRRAASPRPRAPGGR